MFVEYPIAPPVTLTKKVLGGMKNQNMNGFLSNTKFFNSKTNGNTNCLDGNANGGDDYEEITNSDSDVSDLNETDSIESSAEGFLEDAADYSFDNIGFNKLIGEKLLDLMENYKVTTATSCKISEFLMDIIQIDRKRLSNAIKIFAKIFLLSKFFFLTLKLKKFYILKALSTISAQGKISLSNYFPAQNLYLEPVEKLVGFDREKGKADSLQYIPILSTLKVLLQHEDVLGHVYEAPSIEAYAMTTQG